MAAIATLPAPFIASPARDRAVRGRSDALRGGGDTVLVSVPTLARRPFVLPVRLAATVALVLAGVLALAMLVVSPAVTPGAGPAVAGTHVVEAGESMWSIAVEHAPAGEAAGYVEHLVELNGAATVTPGQVVSLPRS